MRLVSDADAVFDTEVESAADEIAPQVTWGTSPEMVAPVTASVPTLDEQSNDEQRKGLERALEYMGLEGGQSIESIYVDRVFIGSCTNSRIEDMRAAAAVAKGRQVASSVKQVLIVPVRRWLRRRRKLKDWIRCLLRREWIGVSRAVLCVWR